MSNPRHIVLYIPAEKFPTHQSFMAEVYSVDDSYIDTTFLMRTNGGIAEEYSVRWNRSKVYVFQHDNRFKLLQSLYTYFYIDIRVT